MPTVTEAAPSREGTHSQEEPNASGTKSPTKERAGTGKAKEPPADKKETKESAVVKRGQSWIAKQDEDSLFEVHQSEASTFLHAQEWAKAIKSYTKVISAGRLHDANTLLLKPDWHTLVLAV